MEYEFLNARGLQLFAKDVVRGYLGDAAYGFVLSLSEYKRFLQQGPTGKGYKRLASRMKKVEKFAAKYKLGKAKFMVALSGDFQIQGPRYNPDDDDDDEEEEEEEEGEEEEDDDDDDEEEEESDDDDDDVDDGLVEY